jgi:hypothetical protein
MGRRRQLAAGAALGGLVAFVARSPRVRRWTRSTRSVVAERIGALRSPSGQPVPIEPLRERIRTMPPPVDPRARRIPGSSSSTLSDLVAAERDQLTIPGTDHRRREQTAGQAAQDIAAAQVRSRRNSHDDLD